MLYCENNTTEKGMGGGGGVEGEVGEVEGFCLVEVRLKGIM